MKKKQKQNNPDNPLSNIDGHDAVKNFLLGGDLIHNSINKKVKSKESNDVIFNYIKAGKDYFDYKDYLPFMAKLLGSFSCLTKRCANYVRYKRKKVIKKYLQYLGVK